MNTLYLVPETWDLTVDASGNIAVATSPYAPAQDVASACMLWKGEALFDATRGIAYREGVLGQRPPTALLADWFRGEAQRVPDVVNAEPVFRLNNRKMSGQITIELTDGTTHHVTFI